MSISTSPASEKAQASPSEPARASLGQRLRGTTVRVFSSGAAFITIATVLLFGIGQILAPGVLEPASIYSMLPYAAVLAIIAVGQTIVVAQRGLDLSVPGMVSLGAVLVTKVPSDDGTVWVGVLLAILITCLAGAVSGIIISATGVTPLIVTLAMNAALIGAVLVISGGIPAGAKPSFNEVLLQRTWGVPNTVVAALLIVLVIGFVFRKTITGHRLQAIGVSEGAARVLGLRVSLYTVVAYSLAGACFGIAGAILAGYIQTPPILIGDQYLLPSVAAVVLGGTALTGGRAGIVASAIAALFLTQLSQIALSLGWKESVQMIAQAIVLIGVVILRIVIARTWTRRKQITDGRARNGEKRSDPHSNSDQSSRGGSDEASIRT